MAETATIDVVSIPKVDWDQNSRLNELEHKFDIHVAEKAVEERSGKKIEWKTVISATVAAVGLGGGFATLYLGQALDPLEDDGLQYKNSITILERDVAVLAEKVSSVKADSIEATDKLVAQLRRDIEKAFEEETLLEAKIEGLEEEISLALNEQRFEEKMEGLAIQRSQAIESVRTQLSEDIDRIDNAQADLSAETDNLQAALAETLDIDDFEIRFTALRDQRERDLDVLSQQRDQDQVFRDKQRDQDQNAMFRIIGDRITPRIDDLKEEIIRIIDGQVLPLTSANQEEIRALEAAVSTFAEISRKAAEGK